MGGQLRPKVLMQVMRTDMYSTVAEQLTLIIEGFVAAFILTFLAGEFQAAKLSRRKYGNFSFYLADIWTYINWAIIILYLCTVGYRIAYYFDPQRMTFDIDKTEYQELGSLASMYSSAFNMDAFIVFLCFFKFFKFFVLNRKMNALWCTFSRASTDLAIFLFMFSLIFMGFSIMANNIFGADLYGYRGLANASTQLMLTLLGQFDLEELTNVNSMWAPIFFASFMIMMFFIMLNVFLAILNDAYSSVQEDVKKEAEYEEWKYNRLSDEQKEALKMSWTDLMWYTLDLFNPFAHDADLAKDKKRRKQQDKQAAEAASHQASVKAKKQQQQKDGRLNVDADAENDDQSLADAKTVDV